MLSIWTVSGIVAIYLLALFLLAFWANSHLKDSQQHPVLYSLALGVHCTSWAFFGTTTQAAQFGWAFIPTYMGIVLAMMFGFSMMLKMARLTQQYNASSLADFIGIRYLNSHWLSGMITVLCVIGVTPYIALQLDAITESIAFITASTGDVSDTIGLYVTAVIAIFAILFGTRTLSLTDKRPGLLLTIAVESIVKLAALLAIGLYVCFWMYDSIWDLFIQSAQHNQGLAILNADASPWVYASHVILGICSLFILPRQFHMNFVELNGEGELHTARWLFPMYLVGMTLFILPIALAGNMLFDNTRVEHDVYVLAIPLAQNNFALSIVAFVGGLSATTSMIIVATLALGIMISNNLVTPLWLKIQLKAQQKSQTENSMSTGRILSIRRVSVLVVLSVAYWYHINVSQAAPLVKSGTIAIALLAQTFPILVFGLYWKKRNTGAAFSAMAAGFLCWLVGLLYPSIMSSYYFDPVPTDAQLGAAFVVSLIVNCLTYLLVTALVRPKNTNTSVDSHSDSNSKPDFAIRINDLVSLTRKALPTNEHNRLVNALSDASSTPQGFASHALVKRVEALLAAQVGSPSARILLSTVAQSPHVALTELVDLVEEASQSFQFNHEVLQSSVQHIEQGISVLDQNLNVLAWNDRYIEMFDYPSGFIKVGLPLKSLLRFNINRGLLGQVKDIDDEIDKRINYIQQGSRYKYIRKQLDGRVIELNGSPLPGGGFVTTYSDITEYIHIQDALTQSKTLLEDRVKQRTHELNAAKLEADKANVSKTKFLAAAGHDLMQPFNAATLFASMLERKTLDSDLHELSQGVLHSLNSAESLLTMLLDMTKLESGVLTPNITEFAIDEVLYPLFKEFSVISQEKQLSLHYVRSSLTIKSDKKLIRRIAQNLLSNAVRYTQNGRVLMGVRRKGDEQVELWVNDTGPGIPNNQQKEIFNEFHRLDNNHDSQGLGLGLTIVERISHLLAHPVSVSSTLGKGTRFCVNIPRSKKQGRPLDKRVHARSAVSNTQQGLLDEKHILLIENDEAVAKAMSTLLSEWGANVITVRSLKEALEASNKAPDFMLLDYHLDYGETGIEAANALRQVWGKQVPGVLNTANRSDDIQDEAMSNDLLYLPKPVKPAALKRMLKKHKLAS